MGGEFVARQRFFVRRVDLKRDLIVARSMTSKNSLFLADAEESLDGGDLAAGALDGEAAAVVLGGSWLEAAGDCDALNSIA